MRYYLLVIEGDVEPNLMGPYTQEQRDDEALKWRRKYGDQDGLFMLDFDPETNATTPFMIDSYSAGFFEDDHVD